MNEKEAVSAIYASPLDWLELYGRVEDKNGKLITPVASRVQRDIIDAYEWLTLRGLPVRLAALPKARQSYVSTVTAALFYHHWRRTKCNLLLMADETSRVIELWGLLQRFHIHDGFEPLWDSQIVFNTEFARMKYKDEQGRNRECYFRHETSSDPDAGAATARQGIWFSEACLYAREGDAADFKVIGNALASVGNAPETLCVMESRAKGPSGYGYTVWQGAVSLEERKAGKVGNSWIKIFCPWHDVAEYRLDRQREDSRQWFDDADERFAPYREREKAGVLRFGWTPEQVAWRRWKLISEMESNESEFDSQFPDCEEAAFRATGSPRFHPVGVANMLKLTETWHDSAALGTLEENAGRVRFVEDRVNGWLWLKEKPKVGSEVCMFSDVMTGEQSAGSAHRDCHAPGILRNAFRPVGSSTVHPKELVAAIHVLGGCRWDIDYLAEKMALLSRYFDNCICVPEANNPGIALILALKALNVPIWQRDQPDSLNPGKKLKVSGWRTDGKTRDIVVETVAKHVRESSGDPNDMLLRICYGPAAKELSTFIRKENGRCEASANSFDDWVLGIGIALAADAWSPITPEPQWRDPGSARRFSGVCT